MSESSLKTTKVFADAYQMTLTVFSQTKNFPKHLRPTLGRRLEESCLDLTIQLRLASYQNQTDAIGMKTFLHRASENLDQARILLQMSRDLNLITPGRYEELSTYSLEIGREVGGWIKFAQKKRSHSS
jgi:hypothetical protein